MSEELTQEQLDRQELEEARDELNKSVMLGKSLKALRGNPHFNILIEEMFITNGRNILWENIRTLTEGQLTGRGGDTNQKTIDLMTEQVKARLILEGFLNAVEQDAIGAEEALGEMDAEIIEEGADD